MKEIISAFRLFVWFTIVLGIVYPLMITLVAQIAMSEKANGSLIPNVGSRLIGQNFTSDKYFWGRPSASDYNAVPSAASNLGPTSKSLDNLVKERMKKYSQLDEANIPQELLYASGSGLDPHISPEAAKFQIDRISNARNLNETESKALERIILENTQGRWLGFLGQPTVNVLELNVKLDER
jgi:K+-transporting ATPase ATPase C chain